MGHISTVEVRYAETDQMGIAHHSNYAIWFEVARTDFIKAAGISYTDVEKEGIITPLTGLECKYKKAAFYEDQLQIHVNLTKLTPVRLEFSYKVTRGDDLIATGKTTHGMVTKDLKPINVKRTSGNLPNVRKCFGLKIT
ncbi:MAG: acyl-CoA thioesterase [Anaerostipes sp.]